MRYVSLTELILDITSLLVKPILMCYLPPQRSEGPKAKGCWFLAHRRLRFKVYRQYRGLGFRV